MKITREEVLKIKPNSSIKVRLSSYKECDCAKAIAYRTALACPRPDVERYKCCIDSRKNIITITAISRKGNNE